MQNSKKILREQARQKRSAISDEVRVSAQSALHRLVSQYLDEKKPQGTIGTYYPYGGEIHPPHHLERYEMALPVIRQGITLEFYRWNDGEPVVKRDFNIPIPDTRHQEPIFPACILLPLVLCDTYGNRIGQGAGHYDRYVASLDYKPLLIGVCFEEQVSQDRLPAEPHDIGLDVIITPQRIIGVT